MSNLGTSESIRLVVWDLDETLWRGTLDDLAIIEHVDANYEAIRELNRRGIMNSVCSKNNFEAARDVLQAKGVWDELIFPSIDWTSKGPRLIELISSMQLRPESVLFIDDNETNLAEAQAMAPGIQVAGPSIIKDLLSDLRLQGDKDLALTRLAHYRILKRRHEGRIAAKGDNSAFLRNSDIKIILDRNIEANIDRAVELINRTNQLNFTKYRLSKNTYEARDELRMILSGVNIRSALIKVTDAYGDHGYCGFYALDNYKNIPELIHFCFSCRIIGMGVEQKMYELLGYPQLHKVGKVVSNVEDPSEVDWITVLDI